MWVLTPQGFYSVVAGKARKPGQGRPGSRVLMIRARSKADLVRLLPFLRPRRTPATRAYPAPPILYTVSDYPWRLVVRPKTWELALLRMTRGVNYSNFKSEVTRAIGHGRHDTYMRLWSALMDIEYEADSGVPGRAGKAGRWAARDTSYLTGGTGWSHAGTPAKDDAPIGVAGGVTDADDEPWWVGELKKQKADPVSTGFDMLEDYYAKNDPGAGLTLTPPRSRPAQDARGGGAVADAVAVVVGARCKASCGWETDDPMDEDLQDRGGEYCPRCGGAAEVVTRGGR